MRCVAFTLGLLTLLALSGPAAASDAGPFARGKVRVSITGGASGAFGERYYVIGGGAAYYVADGLEAGMEADVWFGADPTLARVSPQARYVLWQVPVIKPYAGAFYKHWFVGGERTDVDSIGGRAGAFYVSERGSFAGIGIVHERYISACTSACSETYPEILLSFTF